MIEARTSSGESSKVAERVSSAFANCSVSTLSLVVVRSLKAWTTSYAGVVRSSGISLPGRSCPDPFGCRARYFAPRIVLIRMAAPVLVPNFGSPLILKVTFTWSPSRSTSSTLPTLTPAMRTSSPGLSPPASENAALYVSPLPITGRLSALNAAVVSSASVVMPTAPITTGLRSRKGVRGRRRIFIRRTSPVPRAAPK